jgi:hypothetical protein
MDGRLLATAGISAILGLAPSVAEAARVPPATLTVNLVDLVGIPQADLGVAKAEAVSVFRHAGIDVRWATGPLPALSAHTAPADVVALFLVDGAEPDPRAGAEVMGEAYRAVRRAYVFCDRLTAESNEHQTNRSVVLGRVMAHEIGHLLLPDRTHSRIGIMRPQVDFEIASVHSFTRDQADTMRALLASHPRQD